MMRFIASICLLLVLFSACKKEEQWESNLKQLQGIWTVSDYIVNGQALTADKYVNMRFNFEICELPKYTYCNGYFTNNQQEEYLFSYTINEEATQLQIKFAALQYADILAQWQAEKKKHIITFTKDNGDIETITLAK